MNLLQYLEVSSQLDNWILIACENSYGFMAVDLQVPYELFNKRFRASQKIIDKEHHAVAATADELEKSLVNSAAENVPDMVALLDTVMEKLRVLKRKVLLAC